MPQSVSKSSGPASLSRSSKVSFQEQRAELSTSERPVHDGTGWCPRWTSEVSFIDDSGCYLLAVEEETHGDRSGGDDRCPTIFFLFTSTSFLLVL